MDRVKRGKILNRRFVVDVLLLMVLRFGCLAFIGVSLSIGSPQGQVVAQQLHDQRRILVRILVERVEFSYGVIESLCVVNADE